MYKEHLAQLKTSEACATTVIACQTEGAPPAISQHAQSHLEIKYKELYLRYTCSTDNK